MANGKTDDGQSGAGDVKYPGVEAIKELASLGVKATDATVVTISTDGLGEGVPSKVPAIFDRNGQRLGSVKALIEEHRARPERRVGVAKMQTLSGFYRLVKRHQDEDSAVFVDMNWRAPKFTAVIDYHKQADSKHEPANLRHRIVYEFPLSEPWQEWVKMNGEPMQQERFAAFIEDHIAEIVAPTEAEQALYEKQFSTRIADPFEVMTLSRGLAVSVDAKVGRAVKLQSGEGEIVFEEVHRDGGGEKLIVPGLFMLSVPVFFRGANVRFPVRLRYRVAGGSIIWFYQVWRPEDFVTAAIEKDRDAVVVETGLPAYEGAPEA